MSETKTDRLDAIARELRYATYNQPMSPVEAALLDAVRGLIDFIREEIDEQ